MVMVASYCGDGCFLLWWWLLPTMVTVASYCGDGCFLLGDGCFIPWWWLLPTVEMASSCHGDGCFLLWRWLLPAIMMVVSYRGELMVLTDETIMRLWLLQVVSSTNGELQADDQVGGQSNAPITAPADVDNTETTKYVEHHVIAVCDRWTSMDMMGMNMWWLTGAPIDRWTSIDVTGMNVWWLTGASVDRWTSIDVTGMNVWWLTGAPVDRLSLTHIWRCRRRG